jgi:hypothetical protein
LGNVWPQKEKKRLSRSSGNWILESCVEITLNFHETKL